MLQQKLKVLYIQIFLLLLTGCRYSEKILKRCIPFSIQSREYLSNIDDKVLSFAITEEVLLRQPKWSIDKPPPISMNVVATAAKAELPKYGLVPNDWYIQTVSIDRVGHGTDGHEKWIYVVSFHDITGSSTINLPVELNGKPLQGHYHQ